MDKIEIRKAVKIAEQLRYSDEIIKQIKNAKTEREISSILASGRKKIGGMNDD